jgi:Family of unknown function (DUF6262)
MTPTNISLIETICRELAANGTPITFTTIADRARLSRTTLYRDPQLRAVIEEHKHRSHDPRTLASLTTEIGHLRTAVSALADRVRHQEERLRRLETSGPRKAN